MIVMAPAFPERALLPQVVEVFWLWQFIGRLHPMIVHLPLTLLVLAAVLEFSTIKNYHSKWRTTIDFMVVTGCISAVISVVLGLLLKFQDGYEGRGVDLHQYLGITASVLSMTSWWLTRQYRKSGHSAWLAGYRTLLASTMLAIVLTGHYGASLTHGSTFLTEVLPTHSNVQSNLPAPDIDLSVYNHLTEDIPDADMLRLLTGVRTIFAHSCYRCHSSDKIEGELRLDEREFVFKGGENGPVIKLGEPRKSELIRRISLPAGHDDVMPSKGKLLSKEEIEMISLWIEKGAFWPENADDLKIFRNAPLAPRQPPWPVDSSKFENKIDVWVDQYFASKSISWAQPVDDRTYLRRIYLDLIGWAPSPSDLERFESDPRPNKRNMWARELLERNEDYALHWLTFWNDILRNDYTGTGYITGGRHSITTWLYDALYHNKPYQDMAKELLSPDESSMGFIAGIEWRGDVNSSQTTEMQAAQNVAQVMLGLNLKCASCHDSFISDWKLKDAYGFANIFSETMMEINRCDQPTGEMAESRLLWEELGTIDSAASREERLSQMAEKLTHPDNGRLYRTMVNRIWAQLMGRGIIEPVDEMDELPWSQDLLDWLAISFVGNGFDIKNLIYTIVTSRTYQLPSTPVEEMLSLKEEGYIFRGPVLKKISAEQFSDMVSIHFAPLFTPEERKFIPPQGDTTFIRASQVANNAFLTALGRPNREVVVTDRTDEPNLLQALELTNGERLLNSLEQGARRWRAHFEDPEELVNHCYEIILGRKPTSKEIALTTQVLGAEMDVENIQDFFWAMVLHPEVQFIQ